MKMIGHEGPGIDADLPCVAVLGKTGDKILSIFRSPEYLDTLYPPRHDVVKGTGGI
jgi:hypothetical protein